MYGGNVHLPARLSTTSGPCRLALPLEIADELSPPWRATLEVQWEAGVDLRRVALTLNGTPLSGGQPFAMEGERDCGEWYAHDAESLRSGANTLGVAAEPSSEGPSELLLKQVRASIRYG